MDDLLNSLREHITKAAADPAFVHHKWFSRWHLEVVEALTNDMLDIYPEADRNIAIAMAWMHDYGKILDFDNQYDAKYVEEGRLLMLSLGFEDSIATTVADNIKILDAKDNLQNANLETQIVSSADGCSHVAGPFMDLYWWENPNMPFADIMQENANYLSSGWQKKIVIPEAIETYRNLYEAAIDRANGTIKRIH